jgi:hypothetical protein
MNSNENSLHDIYFKKFSIIIPAYNEEKRILLTLNEVCSFISKNMVPWNVIVSIDGNDGTEALVKSMQYEYPFLNYLKNNGRSGKGGAIKKALNNSSGDYVILMDADSAISFNRVISYLHLLSRYDFINFDRYRNKENEIPKLRRIVSRGYNIYIRLLFNIDVNDTQCGYKIMRTSDAKKVFERLTITNGFFYSPFFVHLKKLKIDSIEIPVMYKHSEGSKFSVSAMILGGFVSALGFRIRESPFWKYFPKKLINLYYRKFKWL